MELRKDQAGRWITETEYARIHALSRQTLCNWRYQDRKAGRKEARRGFPQYRRFGRAVRYWLPPQGDRCRWRPEKVSPEVSPVPLTQNPKSFILSGERGRNR